MTDAKQRLKRLIELANADLPENHRVLAVELCDLLLDWPEHYPQDMREPFEVLLEKTARLIDDDLRTHLAAKLDVWECTPLSLLNEFYFNMPAGTRDAVMLRNALQDNGPSITTGADEAALIAAARGKDQPKFIEDFASLFGIDRGTAQNILHDQSGRALAAACKGARLGRATFSVLAVLSETSMPTENARERLSSFDTVPLTGAERLLDFWRHRNAA